MEAALVGSAARGLGRRHSGALEERTRRRPVSGAPSHRARVVREACVAAGTMLVIPGCGSLGDVGVWRRSVLFACMGLLAGGRHGLLGFFFSLGVGFAAGWWFRVGDFGELCVRLGG